MGTATILNYGIVASYRSWSGKVTSIVFHTTADLDRFLDGLPEAERKLWSFKKET